MNIGIIGTGRHGGRYAQHISHDIEGLRLAAISRRSAREGSLQAKSWGTVYHRRWQDLINDQGVEAVIAVTPPHLNLAIAKACVAARKPLLIEKPLAMNSSQAETMVTLFDDAGLPLTVGQTLRYNSTILALKEHLHKTGDLLFFHASQRLEEIHHDWLDDPEVAGAGVILHSAIHLFDALRFITGREVTRVKTHKICINQNILEDLFVGFVELDGSIIGTVDASKLGKARSGRYEFVGNRAQIQGDQVHGFVELVINTKIEALAQERPVSTIIPLLTDWYNFLQGNRKNPISGNDGLAAVKISQACLDSATDGGTWRQIH